MTSTTEKIAAEIRQLKIAALHLESLSRDFPALQCNLRRIQASLKMLELNFIDPIEYGR